MLERIRRFFAGPLFDTDEKTRLAFVINLLGWVVIVIFTCLFLFRIFTGGWNNRWSIYILPLNILIIILTQIIMRRGYLRVAAYFAITCIWLLTTFQAFNAGGLRDISIIAQFAFVLLASLLLGWREGLVAGLLSTSLIWYLAFQELNGLHDPVIPHPITFARDLTAIIIITGVLSYLMVYNMNQALSEARVDLRERLRTDEKMQLQAQYLTALHETTFGLLNRLELKPLLESIIDRVSTLLDTPHVGVDLLLPDESGLRQELGRGEFEKWNHTIAAHGQGLVGKVWETGNTIHIEDYNTYPNKLSEAASAGFGSLIGAPLKSGQKVVGTLVIAHTDHSKKFTPEQQVLFERLASLASLAIDNARLYENAQTEIIERKIIEQELRSSEGRFRKVFDNNKIAISIVTFEKGVFLEANEAFWNLAHLSPEKALGRSVMDFQLWRKPEEREQFLQELIETGSLQNVEIEFSGEDGSKRTTLGYYELITIREQLCILCMFYDITEQKQAQTALENAESRTRAIIASIPDLIFEVSSEGVFLDFLASSEMVPIMQPHEFIGRNIRDLFPPNITDQALFAIERAISSGQVHAFEYGLPPEEEIQFFEARATPVTDSSVIIMVRDISQRRWVETEREKLIKELEEKNAESETLRESMGIIAETLDESKAVGLILEQLEKVIPCNSASVQLLKGNVLEIVSTLRLYPPELHLGRQYEVTENEPSFLLLEGKLPYILIEDVQSITPLFTEPPYVQIRTWLAVALRIKGKIIGIITLDGHQPGQFTRKHAELALTYANQVAIALENARLFSEVQRELMERKRLIEELEGKNAELERFTYTVSHDLKSPVITIRGFLGFLEQDAMNGNLPRLRSDIKRISDATEKMQTLLNELLDLSRIGRQINPPVPVSFNEIIQEALEIVQGQIQASMAQVSVQPGMPVVYVDRPRVMEAMQNLIDNAAKFVGENPRIEIGQEGKENGMPVFYVRDNGIGIDPTHHERIFGLFNKLNIDSEGTGVGLALVKRIIELHKGRIWVQSEPGKGATFYFTLPTLPAEPDA